MHGLKMIFVLAVFPWLVACTGANTAGVADPEKVAIRYDGREVSFDVTYARYATFRKALILKDTAVANKDERVLAIVHRIYLSNYDLQLTKAGKQSHRQIESEGQYRVEIQIEAEPDATEDARLRVGEYFHKPEPFDRISYVFLSYFKQGSDRNQNLQASEFGGTLKITSVTDDEIEGEIDVFDKSEFVKGRFKAQRLTN